jgi:hypothetical protein
MDAEEIRREHARVAAEHGPWTAHNVRLAEGLYTISPEPAGDEPKLARIVQVVADLAALSGRSLEELRILDLASLEGMYALELGARGASVLAIEGREANRAKAQLAADALGLDRVTFELGDVRGLSRERHGEFDIVLCLGILYHLDAPDVFDFVEQIAEVCRLGAIFDTSVGAVAEEVREHGGERYHGVSLFEHEPDEPEEVRNARLWSSLDNPRAFAPTRSSLLRLLARSGFTSVFECLVPPESDKPATRLTLLALKGTPTRPLLAPDAPVAFPPEPHGHSQSSLDHARAALRSLARRALRRRSTRL